LKTIFCSVNHWFYHWPAYFIFIIALVIGSFIYKDYGLSWDEQQQRGVGYVSLNYITDNDRTLFSFEDRDYGVALELPLIALEKYFRLEDSKNIYLTRHYILHVLFLLCSLSIYYLSYSLFKSRWIALFSMLALLLHPRIYAHSFFNSKDIPFMNIYLVCFSTIFWADKQTKKIIPYMLLGLLTGLLINLRIMGLMFFMSVVAYLLLAIVYKKQSIKENLKIIIFFSLSTAITLYFSFPYLWEEPLTNLITIFNNMSQFRWNGNVLLAGNLVPASALPWYYFSLWFITTTPLLFLLLGGAGIILLAYKQLKTPQNLFSSATNYHLLLYLFTFFASAIAVVIFKSVLYNGWRQLFFLYPAFVLLASYGLFHINSYMQKNQFKLIIPAAVLTQFILIALFYIFNHPLQHLYFNELLSKKPNQLLKEYEYDYWGTSYKSALELILKMDERKLIKVNVANWPGLLNTQILDKSSQDRLSVEIKNNIDNADYFITNYGDPSYHYDFKNAKIIYTHIIQNSSVFSIWKTN